MFNRFFGFVLLCICISNQQIAEFTGREFYSSVSKHPEQSQWPSEAGSVDQQPAGVVECREAAHKKCQVNVLFWGEKNMELQHISRTFREDLSWCKKGLSISKNRKLCDVFNWKVEKSRWGAWASKCCWILLSGNGEAGQYHARVTCTEQLVAGRCSFELTAFTDINKPEINMQIIMNYI